MLHDVFQFSFTVGDIEASRGWYREVLGRELVHRQRQDNQYARALVGIPDAALEVAQFRIPDVGPAVDPHVGARRARPAEGRGTLATNNVGVAHIAFLVTDIHAGYERLRGDSVAFRIRPCRLRPARTRAATPATSPIPRDHYELLQPPERRLRELGLATDTEGEQ